MDKCASSKEILKRVMQSLCAFYKCILHNILLNNMFINILGKKTNYFKFDDYFFKYSLVQYSLLCWEIINYTYFIQIQKNNWITRSAHKLTNKKSELRAKYYWWWSWSWINWKTRYCLLSLGGIAKN